MTIAALTIALVLAAQPTPAAQDEPTTPPGTSPAATTQPATTQAAATQQVRTILEAMEQAGEQVQSIRCPVRYTVKDELNLAETQKRGTVMFKRSEPHPMFWVHFEKTFDMVENLRVGGEEWWLFRDRWLLEAKAKSKHIIKREIVAPGEEVDFFDLENSRIPMPFGQSSDQILTNFTVKLTAPQVGDPKNTDHLYCIPQPDVPLAREYQRLDYYVDRDLHLPVRIVAVSADGAKVTIADFPDLSAETINPELPGSAFRLPAETEDYQITVEPREAPPAGVSPSGAGD